MERQFVIEDGQEPYVMNNCVGIIVIIKENVIMEPANATQDFQVNCAKMWNAQNNVILMELV